MKKHLITLTIILCIAGVCVVSCPDRQSHKDTLMSLVNTRINTELDKAKVGNELSLLGSSLGSRLVEKVLDSHFEVKNYFLCSVGTITVDSKPQVVSVGVLGHVFAASQKEFDEYVDSQLRSIGR